jgi:hypothetical protein
MTVVKQFFLFNLFLSSLIIPSFVTAEDIEGTPSLNIETYLDENSLNKEKNTTTKKATTSITNLEVQDKNVTLKTTPNANISTDKTKNQETIQETNINNTSDNKTTTLKSSSSDKVESTKDSGNLNFTKDSEQTVSSNSIDKSNKSDNLNSNTLDNSDNSKGIDNDSTVATSKENLKENNLTKDNLNEDNRALNKTFETDAFEVDKSKESIDSNDDSNSKNIENASSLDKSDKDVVNDDNSDTNNSAQSINNPILSQVEINTNVEVVSDESSSTTANNEFVAQKTKGTSSSKVTTKANAKANNVVSEKSNDASSKFSNKTSVNTNSKIDNGNNDITNTNVINNGDISTNKEESIDNVANEGLNDNDSQNHVVHESEDFADSPELADTEEDYFKIKPSELYTPSYLKNVYIPFFKSQYELPQVIDTNTKLLNIRSVSDESILMFDVGVSEDIGILNVDGVPTDNLILNRICGIVLAEKVLRNLSNVSVLFYHKDVQFYAKALTLKSCVIEPDNFEIDEYIKGEKERIKSEFEHFIDLKNEKKLSKPIIDAIFIPYALDFLSKELIDSSYKEIKFLSSKAYYNSLYDGNIELIQFIDDNSKDFLSLKADKEFSNTKIKQLCFNSTFSKLLKKLRDFSFVYKDSKGNEVLQLVVNNLTCDFVTQLN